MKNFYLSFLATLCFCTSDAQQYFNLHNPITLPDKSQEAFIRQKIGYTDLSVSYHSPGARDREVWGGLISYGQVWRAGANENTIFTTTHDIMVEGRRLPAGTYGLHLLPEPGQWTFIFSHNHTSWGSYFYDEAEDALRVTVKSEEAPEYREWMSFDFHNRSRGAASLVLGWADKRATLNISLDINEIALGHIRQQLRSDAYWEWFSWCQAAAYCAEYGINTEEALQWIERSIAMEENFWNLDVKSDLLRQAGREDEAQAATKRALEVATAVEAERYARRFLNQEDFERAEALFAIALEKDKTYWRAHLNMGKVLKGQGRVKEAARALNTALRYAPESRKKEVELLLSEVVGEE